MIIEYVTVAVMDLTSAIMGYLKVNFNIMKEEVWVAVECYGHCEIVPKRKLQHGENQQSVTSSVAKMSRGT